MLQSVQSVVDDRSAELIDIGLDVTVLALDDRGEPSVGQQQATRLPDDPTVVAVVGSVTSLVDEGVQPILNTAGLAMIAPGGGAPWLTARGRPPMRPFATYFRLCAQDSDLGTAAASRALGLGDRRAVVVEDGTVEHASVAAAFAERFARQPSSTLARVRVLPVIAKPLSAQSIARIKAADPQTVLVSAAPERLPAIRDALTNAGVRPRYVTVLPPADGMTVDEDPEAWTGVSAATVGALPQTLAGRPTLVPATPGDQPVVDPGLFGAAAADAATLVVDALLDAGPPNSSPTGSATVEPTTAAASTRRQVVDFVAAARLAGATGPVSFDSYGNVRSRPVGFFTFDDTDWVPQPAVVVRPAT